MFPWKKSIVVCKTCHNEVKRIWLDCWGCDTCHAMMHDNCVEIREIDCSLA